jgi:hypothetical protein
MGVDCKVWLPCNCQVHTVAEVLGKLYGLPSRMGHFKTGDGSWHVLIAGVLISHSGGLPCATIQIETKPPLRCSYHYEPEQGHGRLLIARSHARWVAAGRALVDFFGGHVDYQDCDDSECDYSRPPRPNAENCPASGRDWERLQERIHALKPIGRRELNEAEKLVAYKEGE